MPELEEHIKRINDKIQQLIKNHSFLQKENHRLKQELYVIKAKEKEKDDYVELLTLRIEVLKAARGEMNDDEKKLFEKKINRYLKEIEKCIASLSE